MKTYKAKNGKSYTKKQICEAIQYWKKQLNAINEDLNQNQRLIFNDRRPSLYITQLNNCFTQPARKIGQTETSFNEKLQKINTCVTESFKPYAQIFLNNVISTIEAEKAFFNMLGEYRITRGNKQSEMFNICDSDIDLICNRFAAAYSGVTVYKY